MKKSYSLLAVFAAAVLSMSAQSKLDMAGMRLLEQYQQMQQGIEVANPDVRLVGSQTAESRATLSAESINAIGTQKVGLVVRLAEGQTIDDLNLGSDAEIATVVSDRFVVVSLPINEMEEFTHQEAVASASLGETKQLFNHKARPSGRVDKVHNATELDQAYKGSGVLVGLFDTGVDPNHVNFKKSDDVSTSRVKVFYEFKNSSGVPTRSLETPSAIAGYTTDNRAESHGTHVMGTVTGSYNGVGTWRDNTTLNSNKDNFPLYGVAPEAEVMMSGGSLYDPNILGAVTKMVEYAESQDKPAVINLSLGSIYGPHNGKGSFNEALAELGERAIICVATGNDAGTNNCFTMKGGLNGTSLSNTVGLSNYSSGYAPQGYVFLQGGENFSKIEFLILNVRTKEVVYCHEIGAGTTQLGGASSSASNKPEEFAEAFSADSYITLQRGVYSNDNRVPTMAFTHKLKAGSNSLLRPCLRFTRNRGEVVYGQQLDGTFTNFNLTGTYTDEIGTHAALTNGTDNGSVSDMATCENIVSVGAYTSQRTFGTLSQGGLSYQGSTPVDQACNFSSYGVNPETNEGFPLVSAPGSVLLSSLNTHWSVAGGIRVQASGEATVNNKIYYWGPMQGTSMATPFVTGVVALWLEADPSLTIDEVRDVITTTARKTSHYNSGDDDVKLQWGAGAIDAHAGIKLVLERKTSIGSVWADPDLRLLVEQSGEEVKAYVAGETALNATLFNMTGSPVATADASGEEVTLSTGSLVKGVYVLAVEGTTGRYTRKIVVR